MCAVLIDVDGKVLINAFIQRFFLTHKQLEMHRYIIRTIATDGLVLKHQAISIHSAD